MEKNTPAKGTVAPSETSQATLGVRRRYVNPSTMSLITCFLAWLDGVAGDLRNASTAKAVRYAAPNRYRAASTPTFYPDSHRRTTADSTHTITTDTQGPAFLPAVSIARP